MTIDSIKSLKLLKSDVLLEIGHGNCGHLEKIYSETNGVKYFGLEISETMKLVNYSLLTKAQRNSLSMIYLLNKVLLKRRKYYISA